MARVAGTDLTHAYFVPSIYEHDADPTPNDDANLGYCVGDEWYTPIHLYKCLSIVPGAAVWQRTGVKAGTAAMWYCNLVGGTFPADSQYHAIPIGAGAIEGDSTLVNTLTGDGMQIATTSAVVSVKMWCEFTQASTRNDTRIAVQIDKLGEIILRGENGIYSNISQTGYDGYLLKDHIVRPAVRCVQGDSLTMLPSSYMTVLIFAAPPPEDEIIFARR